MKTKTIKYTGFKAEVIGDNYVEGYASTFGDVDSYNDIVEKGAFSRTLKARKGAVRFLKFHSADKPIGKVVEIREDEKGLWVKAVFSNTTAGQEARTEVQEGVLDSFSIGFIPIKSKTDKLPDGRIVNRILEVKLYEFSLVTFPANEEAVVTGFKSDNGSDLTPDNQALIDKFAAYLKAQQADEADSDDEEEPEDEEADETEGDEKAFGEEESEEPTDEEEPEDEEEKQRDASLLKALDDAIIIMKVARELRQARK